MNKSDFLKLIEPFDNIIFDYGGILIDIDYKKATDALDKLANSNSASMLYSKAAQTDLFNLFETGKISSQDFLENLAKKLGLTSEHTTQIHDAWCAMLLNLRVERVDVLREVTQHKRIFMLSNINAIHEKYMEDYIKKVPALSGFYELFEKVYFSHHVGERKPNHSIFEIVVNENKLDKTKTLFIDDSPQHIEGAKSFGLNTYHLDPPNSLIVGN